MNLYRVQFTNFSQRNFYVVASSIKQAYHLLETTAKYDFNLQYLTEIQLERAITLVEKGDY